MMIAAHRGVFTEEIEHIETFQVSTVIRVVVPVGHGCIHMHVLNADLAPILFAEWRQE